jgi:peptidoglycan/xylan/chitin deacetylase (PgdA/CDA1 family)
MSAKTLLFQAARWSGVSSLVRSTRWRQSRLMILGYHGISRADEHEWNPELYMTADFLRERLRLLRTRGYSIIPLETALRQLHDRTLPRAAVSITFDDGSFDFAERALPVLEEFNVPTTLYLTTYYCFERLPVFDTALSYILWKGRECGRETGSMIPGVDSVAVHTPQARAHAWQVIQHHVRREAMDAREKNALLRLVAGAVGVDFDAFLASQLLQLMTPEQVNALPAGLVDVQLHTHRHRTPHEEAAFKRELQDNQAGIALMTGNGSLRRHFCYPSGQYAGEFLPWLRDRGIESATTCVPGLAAHDSDPLCLPRFMDTMCTSALTFEAWTSGEADLLPRRAEHRFDPRRLASGGGAGSVDPARGRPSVD